jgi:uncharacterized protein
VVDLVLERLTLNPGFDEALAQGVLLFNRQEFYEAHEVWEGAWIDELSDDRKLLQGLIQAAAGFYKLQTGAPQGTVKLLDAALQKLRPFLGRSHGVLLEPLLAQLETWCEEARGLVSRGAADYDPKRLPRIDFMETSP